MFDVDTPRDTALVEIRAALSELARGLEPSTLTLGDARTLLSEVVAVKNVAATLEGRLARRVADAREWERAGFPTPEAWLAQQTGTPLGRAKEILETAGRLDALLTVAEAANEGWLSSDQVAVIADAATADPSAEEQLIDSARRKPLSTLRDECAAVKRAADPDPEAAHRRLWAARQLQFSRALDGAARLFGATTPEQMAVIKAAVERRGNQLFDHARAEDRREPREAYLMDALAQICNEWLRGQATDLFHPVTAAEAFGSAGGNTLESADSDQATTPIKPAKRSRGLAVPPGYLGLLRLDITALQRGRVDGDESCEIAGLGPIPVSVARRLLGDAVLKLVLTKGVDVANVTSLGRGPTAAQKIALLWGAPGCVVTGCPRMAGIEHDHRIEWRHSRHTTLSELDRLCDHHHDLKTYKGWALIRCADGGIDMVPPTEPRHPRRNGGPAPPDEPRPAERGTPPPAGPGP